MHVRVNSYHAHALISAALNSTEERNVLYGCCFVVVVVVTLSLVRWCFFGVWEKNPYNALATVLSHALSVNDMASKHLRTGNNT